MSYEKSLKWCVFKFVTSCQCMSSGRTLESSIPASFRSPSLVHIQLDIVGIPQLAQPSQVDNNFVVLAQQDEYYV